MANIPRGPDQNGRFRSNEVRIYAMSSVLANNWWAVAIRGIAAILFGLIALLATGAAIATLVIVFGLYMLVDSVFALIAAVRAARHGERWALLVLEAIANLAAGVIAFAWPGITVFAFVIVVAAWALLTGALAVVAAFRLKMEFGRVWMAIGGIASILLGALLVIAPFIGAVVLTWWLGAYAIVFGVSLLVLAYRLRVHRHDERGALAAAT